MQETAWILERSVENAKIEVHFFKIEDSGDTGESIPTLILQTVFTGK